MSEKVLVTGGAGYIGSILVPELLKNEFRVTVLDNLMYDQTSLLDCCANSRFDFIKGDICNYALIDELLPKFDIIIPLAAIVGAPACKINPTVTRFVNYESHMHIVESVVATQMVLFPTTNSGYGIGEKDAYCTEESPLRPVSEYGRTKVTIEKALLDRGNAVTFACEWIYW